MKNRLRVERAERQWSQAKLAEKLEVSRQTINSIETGKYDPSLQLAFKISRLFGKRIEELFDPAEVAVETSATPEKPTNAGVNKVNLAPF